MLGVVATTIAVVVFDSPLNVLLFKCIALIIAIMAFVYVMLTGLYYSYPTKTKRAPGLGKIREFIRQKTYIVTIWFFWAMLAFIAYLLAASLSGVSIEQAQIYIYILLVIMILIYAVIGIIYFVKRRVPHR